MRARAQWEGWEVGQIDVNFGSLRISVGASVPSFDILVRSLRRLPLPGCCMITRFFRHLPPSTICTAALISVESPVGRIGHARNDHGGLHQAGLAAYFILSRIVGAVFESHVFVSFIAVAIEEMWSRWTTTMSTQMASTGDAALVNGCDGNSISMVIRLLWLTVRILAK